MRRTHNGPERLNCFVIGKVFRWRQIRAQDPLSLAYTFAFVPPKGKEYDIIRADGRGLTPFRFTVVGNEKIATPLGEMQTLHVEKVRDGPDDKATDIWFATERDFIPVRVLIVDKDGERADQIVTRIEN